MILKIQFYLESKEFSSDASVDKNVIEENLSRSIKSLLGLRSSDLKKLGDNFWNASSELRTLLIFLKDLECSVLSNKQVLEKMRTGIKEKP